MEGLERVAYPEQNNNLYIQLLYVLAYQSTPSENHVPLQSLTVQMITQTTKKEFITVCKVRDLVVACYYCSRLSYSAPPLHHQKLVHHPNLCHGCVSRNIKLGQEFYNFGPTVEFNT